MARVLCRRGGVEVSQGDIFETQADAIVSPANSFGYMDGGIDLAYSQHFGWDLQRNLQRVIRDQFDGELPVGQAMIVGTGDQKIPYMVSAPTMRLPMNVAETLNAYLAFRAVLRTVREHNEHKTGTICRVLCPGLGTAVGRMPPRRCADKCWQPIGRSYSSARTTSGRCGGSSRPRLK